MRYVDVDTWWNKGMVERTLESNEPQRCGGCSMGLEEGGAGFDFEDAEEQSTAKRPTPTCISSLSPRLFYFDLQPTDFWSVSSYWTGENLFSTYCILLIVLATGKRSGEGLRVGCRRGGWPEVKKNWIRRYEYEFMRDATSCDSFFIS